jgi:hypothetical protein
LNQLTFAAGPLAGGAGVRVTGCDPPVVVHEAEPAAAQTTSETTSRDE